MPLNEFSCPSRPRMLSGVSELAIHQVAQCQEFQLLRAEGPSAEECGNALLGHVNLRDAHKIHLEAQRVRFLDVPSTEYSMRDRIEWMIHSGSQSEDPGHEERAREAIEISCGQIAGNIATSTPRDSEPESCHAANYFDPEMLAEELAKLAEMNPALVGALFRGDLDDVPGMIDLAVLQGAKANELVGPSAMMFVCWALFEIQREACLGWHLLYHPFEGIWGINATKIWTIKQVLQPKLDQYDLAKMMASKYRMNLKAGVTAIEDGRITGPIRSHLTKLGFDWINQSSEKELFARLGNLSNDQIEKLLEVGEEGAATYNALYIALSKDADGNSKMGLKADRIVAPISAVQRVAIVCARASFAGAMAANALTTADLRAILDTRLPDHLRPSKKNTGERPDQFRVRQLLHIARVEFVHDGDHVFEEYKDKDPLEIGEADLDLPKDRRRKGRRVLDKCWHELNNQPTDWQFMTPFGWQCSGERRTRFCANDQEDPRPKKRA